MFSLDLAGILTAAVALVGIIIGFGAVIIELRRLQREQRDEQRAETEERRRVYEFEHTLLEDRRRIQLEAEIRAREDDERIQQLRLDQLQQQREFLAELRADRRDRREEDIFATEERRLTEVNILVRDEVQLTSPSSEALNETPFVVFRLPLQNIGDGPVDILASLVSSRILSSKAKPGIGLRSRDVEWGDYETYFWNTSETNSLFAGISTTKNMVNSVDHLVRLAAREHGTLRRIDAVNNIDALQRRSPIYMMYRVFLVARGYPLGEILRQLGGGPPDPLQSVDRQQLNFRNLAQPNTERWKTVQEALLNLNRLVFRLASGEQDPLGQLTDPDAWRFFLLHHQDFVATRSVNGLSLGEITDTVWNQFYPQRILPRNFGQDAQFNAAQDFCQRELSPMVAQWRMMLQDIAACHAYDPTQGYSQEAFPHLPLENTRRIPREGYPMRIHGDATYRERWLNLLREGYLVSRPFLRTDTITYSERDIPDDPRVLEPFVTRLHFFLNTVDANASGFRSVSTEV